MGHPGFTWSLTPEDGQWRWMAAERGGDTVHLQGVAASRAEAAAYLARVLALGVLDQPRDLAA